MCQEDITALQIQYTRLEGKIDTITQLLSGFCSRQETLNAQRTLELSTLDKRVDGMESYRDQQVAEQRIVRGFLAAAWAAIVALAGAAVKLLFS